MSGTSVADAAVGLLAVQVTHLAASPETALALSAVVLIGLVTLLLARQAAVLRLGAAPAAGRARAAALPRRPDVDRRAARDPFTRGCRWPRAPGR